MLLKSWKTGVHAGPPFASPYFRTYQAPGWAGGRATTTPSVEFVVVPAGTAPKAWRAVVCLVVAFAAAIVLVWPASAKAAGAARIAAAVKVNVRYRFNMIVSILAKALPFAH
jgi:hypothetical protein